MNKNERTGFVLAGGQSSRMGTDKGRLQINGQSFVARQIGIVQTLCYQSYLLSSNSAYPSCPVQMIPDHYPGAGPLAGIHAALQYTRTNWNLILSCDAPFVTPAFFEYLISHCNQQQVVMPADLHQRYPLIALWHKSALPLVEKALKAQQHKVFRLLEELDVETVSIHHRLPFYTPRLLANINTPEDFERYIV